ncbi:MAG TPA: hypothetical protein VHW23_04135 [Kofleriaceae bacterium]|nr:hypothetical protein [Kofleriaceae bacterium]
MRTVLAVLLLACVWPRTAHAGRTFYGWLTGTEVLPERGVELQTWIQDETDKYTTRNEETWLAWGVMVGVTDRLEIGLPVELYWVDVITPATDGMPQSERVSFTFKRFGLEARYRFASPDPVDAPALVPLLRVAVKRDVTVRDDVRVEGDAVASYQAGPVQLLADVGFSGDIASGASHLELHPGAGISVQATGELRVGAEVYTELSLDSRSESWATAGPDLSWTHGRFWVSGAFGIGLYRVQFAPRVIWGIAF